MNVVMLSAGTGGRKLVAGFAQILKPEELIVIANTGDDFVHMGLYISPDIDSILYQLSGLLDEIRGWGRSEDTFNCLDEIERLGGETWFKLGDKDLAMHIMRTAMLRKGLSLTDVTAKLASILGIQSLVLPMSDDQVQTKVVTEKGLLTFNEYYVKERCSPKIMGTIYEGAKIARPGPRVLKVINDADIVVIGPSNPIAGIGPILSLEPIRNALKLCRKKVVVVSPIVGDKPVSGPSEKMMQAEGVEVSALGVARLYSDVASKIYIHHSDRKYIKKVEDLQMGVITTNILMKNLLDSSRLAQDILMSSVPRP